MDRLNRDYAFFRQELENEQDQFRRNLVLGQIHDIQLRMLRLLRLKRQQAERQYKNLHEALDACQEARGLSSP